MRSTWRSRAELVSRAWRGAAVEIAEAVRLVGARHPLLDRATAVPIDLDLGDVRALVISGPNTGGKTVALKTLGLAALLHQAGLRPPAELAVLPVFDAVLADIGDRQSIEMSLSTFSGHVENLVAILDAATARSLVLVDEVASGTDPVEGSALAQALVDRLAHQARLTVVTTHYPELKEWAGANESAVNAATALDPESGEPSYRLTLGRPGISHALQTAERLGLDAAVVADARGARRAGAAADRGAARADRGGRAGRGRCALRGRRVHSRRLTAREGELQAEIATRARSRPSARASRGDRRGRARAGRGAGRARRAADRAARRAARARSEPAADRRLGAAVERAAQRRARRCGRSTSRCRCSRRSRSATRSRRRTSACAERSSRSTTRRPRWSALSGQRVRIALARLRPSRGRERAAEPAVQVNALARGDVSDQLDVRGRRAQDDARQAVRTFIDEAALAGLPRCGSCTAAAPEPCAPRCARSSTGIRSSTGARARRRTAPRSSPQLVSARYIGRDNVRKLLEPLEGTAGRTVYADGDDDDRGDGSS